MEGSRLEANLTAMPGVAIKAQRVLLQPGLTYVDQALTGPRSTGRRTSSKINWSTEAVVWPLLQRH